MARTKNAELKTQVQQALAFSQVSEIELIYKTKTPTKSLPSAGSVKDAYNLLMRTWEPGKMGLCEQFKVMLLNQALKCLGICNIATGTVNNTVVQPGIVLALAILANATGIVIAHNHPSGNLTPSQADITVTEKINAAAKLFDIKLNDHIIISDTGFYSFANEGLL